MFELKCTCIANVAGKSWSHTNYDIGSIIGVKIKIRMKLKHRGGVENSEKTSEVLYLFIDLSFLSFVVMESISILGRLGLE